VIRISEEEIIRAFKKNDHLFIKELYAAFLPVITRYVSYNNGDEDDAKDLVQQALIIVFQKVRSNEFELSCSFKTYLYSVCKNIWLKELRKRKIQKKSTLDPDEVEKVDIEVNIEDEYQFNEQYLLFRWHFLNLSEICRELIKMRLAKVSYEEIAKKLNFKNGEIARKKKYRCKELLVKRIHNDPRYKELEEDEK
jgi:RNA polymerase sigma factor (sigma-70 family)